MFDQSRLYVAALNVAPVRVGRSIFFALSRFSFGYVLGFYFYTMIPGLPLARRLFALPLRSRAGDHFSLWLRPGIPRARAVHHVADQAKVHACRRGRWSICCPPILIFAATIVAAGAFYNFRLVGVADMYRLPQRAAISGVACLCQRAQRPTALLPFAFACFVALGHRWRAAIGAGAVAAVLPDYADASFRSLLRFWLLFLVLLMPASSKPEHPSCCHCFCPCRLE